jgi:hypothetical protein
MTSKMLDQPERVEAGLALTWEPQRDPGNGIVRSGHTSCCGAYELASLGGQYFVLRPVGDGYEETGRGIYRKAVEVYVALVQAHRAEHRSRGEQSAHDELLDGFPTGGAS